MRQLVFMAGPDNATFKYMLLLLCITVNMSGYVSFVLSAEQTLTHTLLS